MKVRKTLLVAAGWAGMALHSAAQVPALSGVPAVASPVPPPPLPIGPAPQATPAAGTTIWSKLGISKEQKDACRRQLCRTPLGQLINNARTPLVALSGGLIPPFCPLTPSAAELADPGAQGAAAAVMQDEAGAKARRAAVRYLGTVDCHYWPEAEDALIASLRGDRNECVRWEAAMALGRGCCCTKKTIEALSIVVSCSDRDGAPKETSYRVHAAAAAALDHCLECYANVQTPAVQTEIKREGTTPPPPEGGTPVPPPVTPDTSSAKPINPGEAKPAPGLMPATPVVSKRPVGPAYYARVAKAPLAAVLTEARRVAEQHHSAPVVADTPFQSQGHTVATLMSYANGPETQGVIPAGMSIPAGEVRAEVVSAKPNNLWDLMTKGDQPQIVVTTKPDTAVAKKEIVVTKPEPVVIKKEITVTKPEPVIVTTPMPEPILVEQPAPTPEVVKKEIVVTKPTPVKKELTVAPPAPPAPSFPPVIDAPATTKKPTPKQEPLTVDFPPPAPMAPVSRSPYNASASTPKNVTVPTQPIASNVSSTYPTITSLGQDTPQVKTTPAMSPYNVMSSAPAKPQLPVITVKSVPAPTPLPAPMPVGPMQAAPMPQSKPLPAPATPVVPASATDAKDMVGHLLKTAKGNGPVEVRKASIQELAKLKCTSPEVMVALDGLSDDPCPAVRAEAIIAAARLRMGQ
jgi:hypothetical protein